MQPLISPGNQIRACRRRLKLTQEDLCGETNMDRSFLSEIETGKINPSFLVLLRLAYALKIPASDLIKGISYTSDNE